MAVIQNYLNVSVILLVFTGKVYRLHMLGAVAALFCIYFVFDVPNLCDVLSVLIIYLNG